MRCTCAWAFLDFAGCLKYHHLDECAGISSEVAGIFEEAMNLGMPELLFIFFLALLIFGPKKLPELGKTLGKGLAEFKKASNELRSSLQEEIDSVQTPIKDALGEPAKLIESALETKKENPTPTETNTPNHG
jgi:sec-independent protein translocase protein TatA